MSNKNFDHDDNDRVRVYWNHYPAGTSYGNWIHMDKVVENWEFISHDGIIYDIADAAKSKVPIAMYSAKDDIIVKIEDTRSYRDILGSQIVDYQEIDGGHMTFVTGKNVTYFS